MLAGKAQLTPQEQMSYELSRGKAQCNNCHRDGAPGEDPLFTDFTASNIGTPANPRLPYYEEDRPDARGYVANPAIQFTEMDRHRIVGGWRSPAGSSFIDRGVGRFLTQTHLLSQPSPVDARWLPLVPNNQGRFRVP